jgi:hypothetical protein
MRHVSTSRRWQKYLEEETGIVAQQWKNVSLLKQRPTAYMLEALARRWPQYAFWLLTGFEDVGAHGHSSLRGVERAVQEGKGIATSGAGHATVRRQHA